MTMIKPRPATEAELAAWKILNNNFKHTTTTVDALLSTATLAADVNSDAKAVGLPVDIWTDVEEKQLQDILNRYNTMGRIISRAKLDKYFITLQKGDLTFYAPQGMTDDEYSSDIYPGLGAVFTLIVIGAVLITAAITTNSALDYAAKTKDLEYRNRLLDADLEMAKAPKEQQKFWLAIKKQNVATAKAASKKHKKGWFENMFEGLGGGLGESVGILAIGGLAFLALSQLNKRNKATT